MGGFGQPLLGALGVAFLLGVGWLVLVIGERRRKGLQQRLATLAPGARGPSAQLRLDGRGSGGTALALRALPQSVLPGAGPIEGRLRARFDLELAAAGNRVGPVHLIGAGLIIMLAVSGFTSNLLGFGPLSSFVIGFVAGIGAAVVVLRMAQRRHQRKFLEFLPDAVDMVARGVRAGLMPMESLRLVAAEIPEPVGSEFQKALREMDLGVEMTEALQHTADRIRASDFDFLVVTLSLQRRTGGALAEALANLSGIVRQRKALRRKAREVTAEAKASALAIGAAPFFAGGGLFMLNPALMGSLFTEPRGRFMLGLAITFLLSGLATMTLIIKRVAR
jgi:tight adherence protein B